MSALPGTESRPLRHGYLQLEQILSDNGSSCTSTDLATWLNVRGAPFHPQTQGKIERWHQTLLKNCILLENYYLPGALEAKIGAFVTDYNHCRYHESLGNLTPADVYFGRGQTILIEREGSNDRPSRHDAYCIAS